MAGHEPASGADGDLDELLAMALSRPSQALARARALLAGGGTDLQASVAHQAAGIVLRDFGNVREAVRELREAVRFARKVGDPQRESDVRGTLGVALVMAGQTRQGLDMLDAVVRASSGVAAGRHLVRRANVLWLLGRNREALRDAQQAVALLSDRGDLVWEARAYNHRADVLLALGATEDADRDYAHCEALFEQCGQQLEYASVRQERGAAAFARGDLPAALAHLEHARHLVDDLGVLEPELFVNTCAVLLAAGLPGEALAEVEKALDRIEREQGSVTRRAELLHCAAQAAFALGDLDLAERRSTEALRLFRRQRRPWWAARAELAVLECRFAAGDTGAALLRRSGRVAAALDAMHDTDRGAGAHLLAARVALALNRPRAARTHLDAAATAQHAGLQARTSGWLARALRAALDGRPRSMLTACRRGLEQLDVYLRTLGATELRVLATVQGAELAGLALRHAVTRGDARQVLEWSERWRAVALEIPPVRPSGDEDPLADLAALRGLARRLDGDSPGRAQVLDALVRERARLEAAVRRRVLRTPGSGAGGGRRFRWEELAEHLSDTTLVELTEVDGVLLAVVARRRRTVLREVGPATRAARSLAHALFALRREAAARGAVRLDLDGIGSKLEADLLGPVPELLGDDPVVVVPTGRLHAVPWGMLPSLTDRPTAVMPSVTAWLRAVRAPRSVSGPTVLVGGPGLSTGAEEIRQLGVTYPEAAVLTGRSATVDRVMAAMDGAGLVHIAAHGTFRADSPLFSALELDDGPLTVYDLERLHRAPHRVILSSCNSAVGAPTGADELLGLVSSLIALGSAGVVASVVLVNDPATVPFMLALHGALRDGTSLAAALARARTSVDRTDILARSVADSFIALGV